MPDQGVFGPVKSTCRLWEILAQSGQAAHLIQLCRSLVPWVLWCINSSGSSSPSFKMGLKNSACLMSLSEGEMSFSTARHWVKQVVQCGYNVWLARVTLIIFKAGKLSLRPWGFSKCCPVVLFGNFSCDRESQNYEWRGTYCVYTWQGVK